MLDCRRVDRVKNMNRFDQSIDQPVPVTGGLHNDAGQFMPIWLQSGTNRSQVLDQPPGLQHFVGVVGDDHNAVVGMQINVTK